MREQHLRDFGNQILKCNENELFKNKVEKAIEENGFIKLSGCYMYDGDRGYIDIGDEDLNQEIGKELRDMWPKKVNIVFSYENSGIFYASRNCDLNSIIKRYKFSSVSDKNKVNLLLNEYI